jgi:maltose alpha-D-glucosyltransferase/alpha-amylase
MLEVSGGWEGIFDAPAREALERSVLPSFLQGQRWFGGKARRLESVRLADWGPLPGGNGRAFLALFEVRFGDGGSALYFLPLAVTPGDGARMRGYALTPVRGPGGEGVLHDALADDGLCRALLNVIAAGEDMPTRAGGVGGVPTAAFAELRGRDDLPLDVVRLPPSSSNSLVSYGDRLLLKLFRRLEAGTNPDFEIGRFLTENADFTRIPRVAGGLEYHRPGFPAMTVAILQAMVANEGNAWQHFLDELTPYFERAATRGAAPPAEEDRPLPGWAVAEPPPQVARLIGGYLDDAATLGRRTAEMHRALARDTGDSAFAPETMTAADVHTLAAEVVGLGNKALDGVRCHLGGLPETVRPSAERLLAEGPAVLERLGRAPGIRPGALKIRCHGDYHLGQVLRADGDFVILDFEGEPARSLEERRRKQSPLRDVAGMLRSFDYGAYAGLFRFTNDRPDDFDRLEPWAALWQAWTSAAYLRAYLDTAAGAPFLPADPGQLDALLDFFMLDKAFYELLYELNNRPDWVRIPLRGILALLDRGRRPAAAHPTKG